MVELEKKLKVREIKVALKSPARAPKWPLFNLASIIRVVNQAVRLTRERLKKSV
jgi:hypothetical protein